MSGQLAQWLWNSAVQSRSLDVIERHYGKLCATDKSLPVDYGYSLLVRSWYERQRGNFSDALGTASSCLQWSRRHGLPEIGVLAKFGQAICNIELGNVFESLQQFEEIANSDTIGDDRRKLARSNLGLILWDLGQVEILVQILGQIPQRTRLRLRLFLNALHGEFDLHDEITSNGPSKEVTTDQFVPIAFHLACVASCRGAQVQSSSWLGKMAASSNQDDYMANLLAHLVTGSKLRRFVGWRQSLESNFSKALRNADADIYRHEVNSQLLLNWTKPPLIPSISDSRGFVETYPWHQYLNRHFGFSSLRNITFAGTVVTIHGRSMDLQKSPTTLKLVRELASNDHGSITRRQLHQFLTRSAYNSEKHDDRLFKLLKRLEKRLLQIGLRRFWEFGLSGTIEIESDNIMSS